MLAFYQKEELGTITFRKNPKVEHLIGRTTLSGASVPMVFVMFSGSCASRSMGEWRERAIRLNKPNGDLNGAEELYRRGMIGREAALGANHVKTCRSMLCLASCIAMN
jgi:hypothetical protein